MQPVQRDWNPNGQQADGCESRREGTHETAFAATPVPRAGRTLVRQVLRSNGGAARVHHGKQFIRGGPTGWVLVQALFDDGPQRIGQAAQVGVVMDNPVGGHVRIIRVEGCTAGGRVDHERAERKDIGSRADCRRNVPLLRGHERRRSDYLASFGVHFAGAAVDGFGDTEIDDPWSVIGNEHVAGFQVPMDHPCTVDVAQGFG